MPKQEKTRSRPEFVDSIIEVLKTNGTLLTGIAVALIILTGLTLVNSPEQWWIIGAAVLLFGAIIFLFMNARVVIKIFVVSIINILMASESFKFGSAFDQYGIGGLIWMCGTFFTFFILIAYSYLTNSGASRWGSIGVSSVFGYVSTFLLSMVFELDVKISTCIGVIISGLIFTYLYKGTRKTRYSKSRMPANVFDEKIEEKLVKSAEESGWNITPLPHKKDPTSGGFLIWDERAYYLYPIDMDSPFSNIGRKTFRLGYSKKDINPWLLNLAFKEPPLWRSRGANINVVLLDMNSKNGLDHKIIGVSLPDSKKKLPIGIFPSKIIKTEKDSKISALFDKIDLEMSPFTNDLNEKQKAALGRINKTEEDEETEIIHKDESTSEEKSSSTAAGQNSKEDNTEND